MPWVSSATSHDIGWTSAQTSSNYSWPIASSVTSWHAWTPYSQLTDAYAGVDFVPIATDADGRRVPALALTDRPLCVYDTSTITGAAFVGEGRP